LEFHVEATSLGTTAEPWHGGGILFAEVFDTDETVLATQWGQNGSDVFNDSSVVGLTVWVSTVVAHQLDAVGVVGIQSFDDPIGCYLLGFVVVVLHGIGVDVFRCV
jgi:hypothetical protein